MNLTLFAKKCSTVYNRPTVIYLKAFSQCFTISTNTNVKFGVQKVSEEL